MEYKLSKAEYRLYDYFYDYQDRWSDILFKLISKSESNSLEKIRNVLPNHVKEWVKYKNLETFLNRFDSLVENKIKI